MPDNRSGYDGGKGIACPAERNGSGADPAAAAVVAAPFARRLRGSDETGRHRGTAAAGRTPAAFLYDTGCDSEAPRHTSECCQDSAVPGQVDQALDGEADLKVDVEDGRFVFHGLAVEL